MWRVKEIFRAGGVFILMGLLLLIGIPQSARAETANGPSLIISQLKITSSNGQFITLYNSGSSALDMSKYQLVYFNNYDLSKATSSRLIALSGTVAPHSYFMVNDDSLLLCYKLTVNSLSLGLSSTAGMVQVLGLNQTSVGGSVAPVLQDYVAWSKTASAGAQTLPSNTNASLHRLPVDSSGAPNVASPGSGSWQAVQPDSENPCNLVVAGSGASMPSVFGLSELLPASEPPVTIVNASNSSTQSILGSSSGIPASDMGLMAPTISEILPNPSGSGNDSTDEFIELYNPNPVSFDLSGFVLQTGTSSLKKYVFPVGTTLSPSSFTAFYSAKTSLTLSNSGSQARLLDPLGNSISSTAVYGTAKDGQSWALAQGKWVWTTDITPGLANVIREPVVVKKTSVAASKSATAKTKAVKVAKTNKKAKVAKPKKSSGGFAEVAQMTPVHYGALALVGGLALLYVAYEYRADMANYIQQLRSNSRFGRGNRS